MKLQELMAYKNWIFTILLLPLTGCSLVSYVKPTIKPVSYDATQQARIHFSGAWRQFTYMENTTCYDPAYDQQSYLKKNFSSTPVAKYHGDYKAISFPFDHLYSLFPNVESYSIGMPPLKPIDMDETRDGLPFKEVVVTANKTLLISGHYYNSYSGRNERCYPDDYYFTPEAGADYEIGVTLKGKSCTSRIQRVIVVPNADSLLLPVLTHKVDACPKSDHP